MHASHYVRLMLAQERRQRQKWEVGGFGAAESVFTRETRIRHIYHTGSLAICQACAKEAVHAGEAELKEDAAMKDFGVDQTAIAEAMAREGAEADAG
eukprot:1154256-Pelagomonas_calceolata.AAC.2